MSQSNYSNTSTAGFDALFDLSFTRFITISMIKIIYILAMVVLGLSWLGIVIGGLTQGFLPFLVALVVATIGAVLYLLLVRVWLELIVVVFRIGENTSIMAGRSMGPETPGFPVAAVAPPPAG